MKPEFSSRHPAAPSPRASAIGISSRYSTGECSLSIEGHQLRMLVVDDPNALSDGLDPATFAEDERFPYWAELWPSSLALAHRLLRSGLAAGRHVVELGCGMGLAGVAAALTGGRVLFTDFEADALAFARANHLLNLGVPGDTRLLDWRLPPDDLRASLVLAADVLYERRFLQPFLRTLEAVLAPGGVALVAEPGRTIAEGTIEALERPGLAWTLHLEEFRHRDRDHAVWVHELHRTPETNGT